MPRARLSPLPIVFGLIGTLFVAGSLFAALTAEHKKELAEVKKDLGKVAGLISKKEVDEAEKLLDESESKLKKIASDAQVPETDKAIAPLLKQIELKKAGLAKRKTGGNPAAAGISFVKDIAPIFTARCLGCHGSDNPRAGLDMSTFAGFRKGGSTGALVTPGVPAQSLLCQKVTLTGRGKMPPQGDPLSPEQIQKITMWIAQGCKFDGPDETAALATLAPAKDTKPVEIVKATGDEKVSFVNDIAPFVSNLCVNCHSGPMPRGGYALDTFEKLMRGGMGGRVLIPGNTKDSRLWHLVGEQDPIKMPPGQALITEKNWESLKLWIEEGCKFDGPDAKAPIRSLIPSEADKRAKEFAALSSEEMLKRRLARAEELWKKGLPSVEAVRLETDDLLLFGNVTEARLQQIVDWSKADLENLRKLFGVKETPTWKGKLAVFVFADHFSYSEFVQTNEDVQLPDEARGHARVTSVGDEAYICLQDVGDDVSTTSGGMHVLLVEQLTAGLLGKATKKVPDWLARGTGLALAEKLDPKSNRAYFIGLNGEATGLVKTLGSPADLFADGTFSSASVGPVGYSLVKHILQVGGEAQFGKFLATLVAGATLEDALRSVYSTDPRQLALSYVQGLSSKPGAKKR